MRLRALVCIAGLLLSSCGDGAGSSSSLTPTPSVTSSTAVYAVPGQESLSVGDVQTVIAHAAAEAQARNLPAVIAVTDRVGNVLAVFRMAGARATATTSAAPNGVNMDAQNLTVPAEAAAIAKAITGAYLSSAGNAFSTRTASEIVQQQFPPSPATTGLESGPLFGVQFSQLPCSDLAARFPAGGAGAGALIGPKRSPLGLAADPGGFPLYKNGVVVGGVGVMADGVYGFDADVSNVDNDPEEYIALAGTLGFEAPDTIRADRVPVDGTLLRYSDASYSGLMATSVPGFAAINGSIGSLVAVRGYYGDPAPVVLAGAAYGTEASGVRASTVAEFSNRDAFVLTDGSGANRFPIRAGTDAGDVAQPLSASEVTAILEEAFAVMSRARAQIREPLNSRAQVSISVVDTRGQVLGVIRSPDAPIFGTDVSLQKARTAAFFSGSNAGSDLLASPSADVAAFVGRARAFLNDPNAMTGRYAFTDRANGNLSRPYFPDGEVGRPNGPFSRPIAQFNPFSTGLQSALIVGDLAAHLAYVTGVNAADTPQRCGTAAGQSRVPNGVQIFPGSVPVYRGNVLIGGVGVSGDGIDQDDMIGFLGLNNAGKRVGNLGNAPAAIRADQIVINLGNESVRLRYINCPVAPFLDTSTQDVCSGL